MLPDVRFARALVALSSAALLAGSAAPQTTARLAIRGHPQTLRLYGARGDPPVIVSSGDGGWIHLAPHVAEVLAAHGYFVAGFDARTYLSSFTSVGTTLGARDEPSDFKVLADFAAEGAGGKPVLVGVSEGAGLSVLAATDPDVRAAIGGVVGLGLPDITELAWRWKDALIYLTHGVPDEPTFSTTAVVGRMAPTPLAVIQSTHDEFVPFEETRRIMAAAAEPKRLWTVDASNHGFSDNLAALDRCLLEALAWIAGHQPAR